MGVQHPKCLVLVLQVAHEAGKNGMFEDIREIAGVIDVAVVHGYVSLAAYRGEWSG
ncbi:hypothetical protein D3C72_2332840 [compost metagenome]